MKETRPPIPEPIKRKVRQRCGFGCVICGQPLYEYDHIDQYAKVKKHEAENLTLLCDKHHREKTNGLLSVQQVIEANKNPYNIVNKESSPYLLNFRGTDFSVIMGDVKMTIDNVNIKRDSLTPFLVNNKKLVSFEIIEKQLFFNLTLMDDKGNLLIKIVENEMVYNSEVWDIEFVGKRLKIRQGLGKIVFDIEFNIPDSVQIHKAQFNSDGYQIDVKNGGFITKGFRIFIKNIMGSRIVCALGKNDGNPRAMFTG